MDKKSKVLLIVLLILVVVSVYLSYVRIFVYKDFTVTNSDSTDQPDTAVPADMAASSTIIFPPAPTSVSTTTATSTDDQPTTAQ